MASQRPQGDVQLYITNPDGTQTLIGEMQSATITQHTEPYPDLEQVLQQAETPTPPPPPEAIAEEPVQISDMEKLLESFTSIEEGNLYSSDVNRAIEIIAGAQTMQEALVQMEQAGLNFRELLFRQIDRESKDLDKFMFELQKIPSLPSMDVDYI